MNALEDIRKEILACCLEMENTGLIVGTSGNISQRIGEKVIITPTGIPYKALKKDDLVVINLQGEKKEGHFEPSSEYQLHLEIYKKRSDVKAIVHTHSTYATAFSVANKNIPCILEEVIHEIGKETLVSPYAPAGTLELAQNVLKVLGDNKSVLLRNHGVVGVGESLARALTVCQIVEKAAKVHLLASKL